MAGFVSAPIAPAIVRQGSRLILPASGGLVILPDSICVRCGAPADGKPVTKWYYWHNPALYLILLLSPLIYIIVAAVVRKRMEVMVPLCAPHAQRRKVGVTLAWVLPLAGITNAIVLPLLGADGGIAALVCTVLILAGIIIWAVVGRPIRPRKIDSFSGEFTGFCEAFLQQFPEGSLQPAMAPGPGQMLPPPPPPIR